MNAWSKTVIEFGSNYTNDGWVDEAKLVENSTDAENQTRHWEAEKLFQK